jgi:two-component system, LytTR family, response regulator
MKIRTLIVDDMLLARDRVRDCLSIDPEIEIIGECKNGFEAISVIRELKPDLVFLDVQMPGLGGFEVAEQVGFDQMPVVIFVTAYDEFALSAFEANALDYVLKPFDDERFRRAVERAKREIKGANAGKAGNQLLQLIQCVKKEPKYLRRILVKTAEQTLLVPVREIYWISAAGNYLEIHASNAMHLIRERISTLETRLNPSEFARIHRSTIVNLNFIKELRPLFNGDHLVILNNGKQLNMSRTYYEKLQLFFKG